jgi:hypothetical protein
MFRLHRAAAALACLLFSVCTFAQVTVTGSHLKDSSGNLISNATISWAPVDANLHPLAFRAGGANAGQVVTTPVTAQVTSGVFTIQAQDTSLTSPVNVCYLVAVTDNVSGDSLLNQGYTCVQPGSGTNAASWCATSGGTTTCNFDNYVPSTPGLTPTETGPAGANGTNGTNGATGPPATFLGAWASGTTYALGNAVSYNGSSYVSLIASNVGHEPDTATADWGVLAAQGAQGTVSIATVHADDETSLPLLRNMSDPKRYIYGDCYSHGNGHVIYHNAYPGWWSGLVPVVAGRTYTVVEPAEPNNNNDCSATFWDASGNPIISSDVVADTMTANEAFVAPSNAAYFGFPTSPGYSYLIEGITLPPSLANGITPPLQFADQPLTPQRISPWYGKKLGVFGDSYCNDTSGPLLSEWPLRVASALGMTLSYLDCRVNRPMGLATDAGGNFAECYGNDPVNGHNNPSITITGWGTCAQSNSGTAGNTIAQDLAGIDVVILELGTNNQSYTVGTTADSDTTDTVAGATRWTVESIEAAAPNARVILTTPINSTSRGAAMSPVAAMEEAIGPQLGAPVIDNYDHSPFGSAPVNAWMLATDGLHPTSGYVYYTPGTNTPSAASGSVPGVGYQNYAAYIIREMYNLSPLQTVSTGIPAVPLFP